MNARNRPLFDQANQSMRDLSEEASSWSLLTGMKLRDGLDIVDILMEKDEDNRTHVWMVTHAGKEGKS